MKPTSPSAPAEPHPADAATRDDWLRRYLYLTAAVTGAAVMIVEILGAKMLAPYVGTSHFVWTAQIAVTLAALASGYYLGGRLADRYPRPGPMFGAILGAALYLGVTIRAVEPVSYQCLSLPLATGSLLASAFLFFVPLALLAMTGPYFIRVITSTISGVGGNVGRLSAIGTFGSLAGTILIGYVLVPHLPNSLTMYLTASTLAAVALIYFFAWGRRGFTGPTTAVAAAGLALSLGGVGVSEDARDPFTKARQVFRGNSDFGQLQVVETVEDGRLLYLNDFLTQNSYYPRTRQSGSMFSYMLEGLARGYRPRLDSVLCIGMGVGIVPMRFANAGVHVDVVEINPSVVPVARQFFDLDPAKLSLTIGDGRQYLNSTSRQYDAVILDAFLGDSSPSHLMSREAFVAMKRVLRPGGVLVINSFCDFDAGKDFLAAALDRTLKSVFQSVKIHADGNVFFVAADVPDLHLSGEPDLSQVHSRCIGQVEEAFANVVTVDDSHGIVLTDDYNPVEYYDAANREEFRRLTTESIRAR